MYLDTNGNKIGGDVAGEDSLDANLRDWTFPISGSGKYLNIRIKYRMDSGNEEVAFDNVRLSGSGSTCGNPQNLSISNITSSTADASWVSNATLAQIQWEASGFTLGNGFKDTSSTGTFSLPSLNSGTTYDVYVKDSCASSSSSWLGPISFTTVSSVCNDPDSLEVSNVSFYLKLIWDGALVDPPHGTLSGILLDFFQELVIWLWRPIQTHTHLRV